MIAATISVIIPVLNEAATIEKTILRVQEAVGVEIIVVDGGSDDETVKLTKAMGVEVITSCPGRAIQMNVGAAMAQGDILLFLHGDSCLPRGYEELVSVALAQPYTIAGAFQLRIDLDQLVVRLVEKMVNLRSQILGMPYGDQAIFLKASVFQEVGGFPELPIMEDFELMRSLRRLGKIAILPAKVVTSGRRWLKLGVVKTTLINQVAIAGYFLGVSPTRLRDWYRKK
ncbi:MAG: TIGR04283 family arsenosugar biosynthesis glycosyltransferase [Spirulinaceae cyanobacterium]